MASRSNIVAGIAVIVMLYSSSLLAADVGIPTSMETKKDVSCELKVKERYEFYAIEGKTLDELREYMKAHGTKWNDGKVYSAETTWNIHYSYDICQDGGRYWIKSVKTKLDIMYRMPHMIAAASNPDLAMIWNNYLAQLQRHEFGHKDIAVKTASEINEIFASLATFSSERALKEEISLRTGEKFQRLKELQVEYDHETRHGETQGAILPDSDVRSYAGI